MKFKKENEYSDDNEMNEACNADNETGQHVIKKSQFQCARCDMSFDLKKHLRVHIRGHSEIRPYGCLDCKLHFKFKQNLIQHRLLHSSVRLYKCHICGKGE